MKTNTSSRSHLRLGVSVLLLAAATLTSRSATTAAAIAQQAYLKASNAEAHDIFGRSVAISGDTLVVAAAGEDSNATGVNGNQNDNSALASGAVYVFVRDGANWKQQAYLKASNAEAGDNFGYSVAISGDTVVVGAYAEASSATGVNGNQMDNSATNSGAAYVFVRNGTNWTQQAYLKASNAQDWDFFGYAVAVSGNTIVAGALGEDSSATGVNGNQNDNTARSAGAAYIFVRSGTNWTQQAYLKASNAEGGTPFGDYFGYSVAVEGDTAVIGALLEGSNATGVNGNQNNNSAPMAGAAYVFVRTGETWSQQAYLKASNTRSNSLFSRSIAISGDTVVIGANQESSNSTGVNGNQTNTDAPSAGAAYVFVRTGESWSQQAYLKASNTRRDSYFGYSAAVSGDTVLIGAYGEAGSSTGVNGNQSDHSAPDAGAAYVFVRTGETWSQQAYLKASNTGEDDYFGISVGVSGDAMVVGAPGEASNATGVNGDQINNSADEAGAVYVFTSFSTGPNLSLVPDGAGGYFLRFHGTAGAPYRVLRTRRLTGPWDTAIATVIAPASGLVEYHDTSPPPDQAFYRVASFR